MASTVMSDIIEIFPEFSKTMGALIGQEAAATKLFLSLLLGYPIAFLYRSYVYGRRKELQHLFFIVTGFMLGALNYGVDMIHPFIAMVYTYIVMAVLGGTAIMVGAVFILNMLHLLIGYYVMSTTYAYDIDWTMPYCILVLRLIGVAFDYYDGQKEERTLSSESKQCMLKKLPEPLEFLGFASFPGSFMIGPLFSMRRYQSYINGEFGDTNNPRNPPKSEYAGIQRFYLGLVYILVHQAFGMIVSLDYIESEDFKNSSFLFKHFMVGLWGRNTLYKYISCWLFAEGLCTVFGITYTGTNENGEKQWDGVQNVKLATFENSTEFNHYIQSFNINTNHWVAHYIYKRLKFLGNKNLSHLGVLLFLAIWHGYYTGYFVTFFFEFLIIIMERDVKYIISSNAGLTQFFDHPIVDIIVKLLLRFYTFVFMGFCLIPFALFTFNRYWSVLVSLKFSGLILFGLYHVLWGPILHRIVPKTKTKEQ